MTKKALKCLAASLCAIFFTSTPLSVNAASGFQGYAIYRDGVTSTGFGNFTWHAAIMGRPTRAYSNPVIHIGGPGYTVESATWKAFLANGTFQGVYRPTSMQEATRDNVVATAKELAANDIGYVLFQQMQVSSSSNAGLYIDSDEITAMRCDGVVEYCYEYNGPRIYGSDSLWDISLNSDDVRSHHSGIKIDPKSQAQQYMTLVQTGEP